MNDIKKNEDEINFNANEKISKDRQYKKGSFIAIGIALGVVYGLLFHNIAIGMCIGIAVGVAIDTSMVNKNRKRQ
jgi:uncharacterized membrane protein